MSFEMPKINKEDQEKGPDFTMGQKSVLMNLSKTIDRAGLRIFSIYKKYGLDKAGSEKIVPLDVKIQAEKEVAVELDNFKKEFAEEKSRGFHEKKLDDTVAYLQVAEELERTYKAGKEKEIEEILSRNDGNNPMIKIDKARISALEFLEERGRVEGLLPLITRKDNKTDKQ